MTYILKSSNLSRLFSNKHYYQHFMIGKTTSSSAIALSLSDKGHRTLIVSIDPAHSLGDALDNNLSSGKVTRITTEPNLWALELDVEESLENFKKTMEGFDSESIAYSLGIPKDIVESFGLDDITSIFTNPPPGIDEIVALTQIFQYADDDNASGIKFDKIVVDTSPTGHTVRLLQLPEFLGQLLTKLIKFRAKIMSAVDNFKSLFGGENTKASDGLNSLLFKLEKLQTDIARVKRILKDSEQTKFVVVTIPTQLAVLER